MIKFKIFSIGIRQLIIICLLSNIPAICIAQFHNDLKYPNKYDYTSLSILYPEKHNGFGISVSLVAMFSSGVADRNGLRIGAGLNISYSIGDWEVVSGVDTYKATENFGIGSTYIGTIYFDGEYGASYYLNRYYQGDKQTSGILGARAKDFQLRFEDDILALPFTGFIVQDRFRTAALELQYRGFLVGTNIYTTDPIGLTDASLKNKHGIYYKAKQISRPIYVGYTNRNLILRYGLNNPAGGYIGQNSWHRTFFRTPDFETGNFSNQFFQLGINKPHTLY